MENNPFNQYSSIQFNLRDSRNVICSLNFHYDLNWLEMVINFFMFLLLKRQTVFFFSPLFSNDFLELQKQFLGSNFFDKLITIWNISDSFPVELQDFTAIFISLENKKQFSLIIC